MDKIPFTVPAFGSPEHEAVNDLLASPEKIISEYYSKKVRLLLEDIYQKNVLLTHSCTAALEMCALLLNLTHNDEVIIPSYTFVSTANAFALFGAKPIFIDTEPDAFNLDANLLERSITKKTKAIVTMHYAGIGCDMSTICDIAKAYKLPVIEDAAQCIDASYQGQKLGTFGDLSALSFHNSKNITAGLGGALIINNEEYLTRAKVIWQKGTNREAFIEGFVDKYTWQDLGSSFTLNELSAALLYGQLSRLEEITQKRLKLWNRYHESFKEAETIHNFKRPTVSENCQHNAHIYYLIAPTEEKATAARRYLSEAGISAPSHYVPLHLSPAGQRLSGQVSLPNCETLYKKIIRLPLWEGLEPHQSYIIDTLYNGLNVNP